MNLKQQLQKRLRGRIVIIGIGNPLRGDDGVGCRIARLLQGTPHAHVFDAEEVPESILGEVVNLQPDTLIFIDGVDLGARPGAVALIEHGQAMNFCPTTHRVPIDLLMTFLRCETGADIFLLGIQPSHVHFGTSMSREVEASATLLTRLLLAVLGSIAGHTAEHLGMRAP